jgi:hypothetical protein
LPDESTAEGAVNEIGLPDTGFMGLRLTEHSILVIDRWMIRNAVDFRLESPKNSR